MFKKNIFALFAALAALLLVFALATVSNASASVAAAAATATRTRTRTATTGPTVTRTRTSTPTVTRTPTISCVLPTAENMQVAPVTSPTSAITQVITVTLNNGISVSVTGPAGTFTSTTPVGGVFSVTVTLVANSTNTLTVQGMVQVSPGCTYNLSKSVDINGNPLTIVQQSVSLTPTRTPTPVSGVCSPAILASAPMTHDGAGAFCLQFSNINSYITFTGMTKLTINGVDFTSWGTVPVSSFPPKINGYWYIYFEATAAWAHFEAY
jgi:hypothetical protein